MTAFEVYHNYVGDQGKAFSEIIRWGAISVGMVRNEYRQASKRRRLRYLAQSTIATKLPEARLHISGERYYVH